jgi:hypothetical protein
MILNKKVLFILLLSLSSFFAVDEVSYCNINLAGESFSLILIGLLISILFVSLFFMYGKFVGSPEVEGTYMVELQQIGITVILIIFISAGIELLCNVGFAEQGVYLGSENNIYNSVRSNQLKLMRNTMDFYISLMDTLNGYGRMSSLTAGFSIKSGLIGIVFSPMPYAGFVTQMMAPIGQSVLIAYFAQAFQYSLFEFSRSKIFLLLLPIGLVLRSFPITRKFGGVLVALVIGISYLYPLFLNLGFVFVDLDATGKIEGKYAYNSAETFAIFNAYAMVMGGISALDQHAKKLSPAITKMIGMLIAGFLSTAATGGFVLDSLSDNSSVLMDALTVVTFNSPVFLGLINKIYYAFGTIIISTFFIPALMIIILGAVVRSLSASIGTETDITGILRAV